MDFVCLSSAGYGKIALLMRNVSFLTTPIMDKQLCELLKQAFQNPEGSPKRDQAAEALALMIDQLPEPKRYLDSGLLHYYDEALKNNTQPDVKKNIHKFIENYKLNIENINCQNFDDTQLIRKKFIDWVMIILKRDCIDIYYKYNPKKSKKDDDNENKLKIPQSPKRRKFANKLLSIDKPIGNNPQGITLGDTIADGSNRKEGYVAKLSGLDLLLQDELKYFAKKIKKYIEEDKDNRLKICHVENRQDCNCQTLVQLRYLKEPPLKLREISEQLEIPLPTISNHIDKKCKKLLRETAKELGYE